MGAEVGRNLLAFGPWGAVTILACLALAFLGAAVILIVASKRQIGEGEIRIRILGISVRWGSPRKSEK